MTDGRHILITGCTRGLGRALVDIYIRQGHQISGCGRSAEQIESLQSAYPDHQFQAIDVADYAAVNAWAPTVIQSQGPPDILINNAALMNRTAPLWEVDVDEFSQLTDVNIKGVFHVIRSFLPAMIQHGSGIIVNLSSGWGRSTSPEVAPYCASKFAIEGLTQALAQELPAGLAAIPLNPGIIDTDMLRSCWEESAAGFETPEHWVQKAAPFILNLGPSDNGKSLSVN
ncbi:MAG: SDR family NAD(P)-dependent oxidoreductase [Verrucomicrobiota bacterium]